MIVRWKIQAKEGERQKQLLDDLENIWDWVAPDINDKNDPDTQSFLRIAAALGLEKEFKARIET